MKTCSKCGIDKSIDNFREKRRQCKVCEKSLKRDYYYKNKQVRINYLDKNKEKIKKKLKKYREINKERIKKYQNENKEIISKNKSCWYYKNKEKIIKRVVKNKRRRYNEDPNFRLSECMHSSFRKAFKKDGAKKSKKLEEYGIDIKAIVEHLGEKPEGDYHIDHIFPVSAFDMNDEEHIKLCWHPDNLQWLEASKNISKSNKYDIKEFEKYIKGIKGGRI